MVEVRLKEHTSANCKVQIDRDGTIHFISYTTEVITAYKKNRPENVNFEAIIEYDRCPSASADYLLICSGTYSKTTARQISWFLREVFPDLNYYDMKKIAGLNEATFGKLTREIKHLMEV